MKHEGLKGWRLASRNMPRSNSLLVVCGFYTLFTPLFLVILLSSMVVCGFYIVFTSLFLVILL